MNLKLGTAVKAPLASPPRYRPLAFLLALISISLVASASAGVIENAGGSGTVQIYLLFIQILWGVLLMVMSFYLYSVNSTLKDIQKEGRRLNDLLLTEYATKADMLERVHGLRDSLGVHSTWIHLIAHEAKVPLTQHVPSLQKGPV